MARPDVLTREDAERMGDTPKTPRTRLTPEDVEAFNAGMTRMVEIAARFTEQMAEGIKAASRSLAEAAKSTQSDYEERA